MSRVPVSRSTYKPKIRLIGHFRDDTFQAITCIAQLNSKQTKYTNNVKRSQ